VLFRSLGAGFPVPEPRHEFDALGATFDDRVRRLDEGARLWRHVWSGAGQRDGFQSRYWQLPPGASGLPAARPGGPPLWLASGDGAGVIARVAASYDGWLPYLPSPERYRRAWAVIRERAGEQGREVTPGLYATVHLDPDRHRAERELDAYVHAYYGRSLAEMRGIQAFFAGPAPACADWLESYLDAGTRHLVLRLGAIPLRRQLERVAVDLLPALRRSMVRGR
jgi:alkanesulfonate monooxygenase SsuD/methylene tetrahydromethanopterin reductase-like flavin-dependent oxidoreductase (luciferase family)